MTTAAIIILSIGCGFGGLIVGFVIGVVFIAEAPGLIVATRISIATEYIRDMDKKLSINLCDDPLYPLLVKYVEGNPPRKG